MLAFPNAKINLGLHVLEERIDGFHNIETVFYPVKWSDVLEIIPSQKKGNKEIQFNATGIKIIGSKGKNLCVKAYQLLKEKYDLPPIQMHLHKFIPMGAGLGGGSSDATQTLFVLNKVFNLGIDNNELEELAASLGSDCAFFIRNKPTLAKERGNVFEEIKLSLKGYFIVIIKPDAHVSTADAYKNARPDANRKSLKEIISKPIEEWKDILINDFEYGYIRTKKFPEIKYLKEELYNHGAVYASMSGSGSAVYGLFKNEIDLGNQFKEYTLWSSFLG
jgi:4-diphosphocytidyl-2-C-methyl-D-erythritol kinase